MTDILSQDEIDALLKAGLGEGDSDEGEADEYAPQAAPSSSPSAIGASAGGASFDAMFGAAQAGKSGVRLKRSAKLDEESKVKVQPAVFPSFDIGDQSTDSTELGTILNIELELQVELGKTRQTIRQVLEMGSGSVLELDKLNGEPVDLIVNKKPFSKGEMIVIGENFGVRVTDILSVQEIIEALR